MNRLRWAARRPSFWVVIAILGFALLLSVMVLGGRPSPVRTQPRAEDFGEYWGFTAFVTIYIPTFFVLGWAALLTGRPVIEIVLPAPFGRASWLQYRARSGFLTALALGLSAATVTGFALDAFFTIPVWIAVLRVAVAFLPGPLFFAMVAYPAIHSFHRLQERQQEVCAVALAAAVVLLVLSIPNWSPSPLDHPVVALYLGILVTPTKLVMGFSMDSFDLLFIALSWTAAIASAYLAFEWPYKVFEDVGVLSARPTESLSRERATLSPTWQRLAIRLRGRYRDLGDGPWALAGKTTTEMLRGPAAVINVVFGGSLIIYTIAALGVAPPSAKADWLTVPVGVMWAAFGAAFSGMGSGGRDLLRLLPLTGWERLLGNAVPSTLFGLCLSAAVTATALATWTPVMTAVAIGILVFSTNFLGSSLSLSGLSPQARFVRDIQASEGGPSGPTHQKGILVMTGFIYFELFGTLLLFFNENDVVNLLIFALGNAIAGTAVIAVGFRLSQRPPRM